MNLLLIVRTRVLQGFIFQSLTASSALYVTQAGLLISLKAAWFLTATVSVKPPMDSFIIHFSFMEPRGATRSNNRTFFSIFSLHPVPFYETIQPMGANMHSPPRPSSPQLTSHLHTCLWPSALPTLHFWSEKLVQNRKRPLCPYISLYRRDF